MEETETDVRRPLPSPPFLFVEGIENFRDLGGYSVVHACAKYVVRRGFIYRCGEPSNATQSGIKTMQAHGITHTYDLRAKNEIERQMLTGKGGVVEWDGCKRIFAPVFTEEDYSPQNLAIRFKDYATEGTEGFTRAYTDILEHAPHSYTQILLHIANHPTNPLIIHCTAGKDRTGVICALILSLCGVDDETVAFEYSLTEVGLRDWKEKALADLLSRPGLGLTREGANNMFSAKAANMMATLKMIRKRYNGPEGYVIEKCGLTRNDVQKIRSNLIVESRTGVM